MKAREARALLAVAKADMAFWLLNVSGDINVCAVLAGPRNGREDEEFLLDAMLEFNLRRNRLQGLMEQ